MSDSFSAGDISASLTPKRAESDFAAEVVRAACGLLNDLDEGVERPPSDNPVATMVADLIDMLSTCRKMLSPQYTGTN